MIRYSLLLLLFLGAGISALGQPQRWELNYDTEIYNPVLSADASRLAFVTDDDSTILHCVDARSGAKLWTRTLHEFRRYEIVRFIGSDTLLAGQNNTFEFLDARTGSVMKTIPIIGEDFGEMIWHKENVPDYDSLRALFEGNLALYYFDEGMQAIDLSKMELIYQTSSVPSKLKYYRWDSTLLVLPVSGADTFYLFDIRTTKLIYKASLEESDLNTSLYQPYMCGLGELLLFTEDNVESIDLATGKKNATIEVDPDDPDLYSPVLFKKALYLLVSDDGIQKMYETKTGKLLWETKKGEVPGIVDKVVELPNDEAMMVAYEVRGAATVYKVNTKTGTKVWSCPLFSQDGELDPGHKQASKLGAALKAFALSMLIGPPRYDRFSYGGFRSSSYADYRRYTNWMNDKYSSWVNVKKSSDGYAQLLRQTDDQVTFVSAGRIYKPGGGGSREYNGEAVATLKIADGSVVSSAPFEMLAKSESSSFNAVNDLQVTTLDSTKVLVGVHDIYVFRGDEMEHIPFGELNVKLINSGPGEVTVRADDARDRYDYWRFNVAGRATQRTLVARSTNPNIQFFDSAAVSTTVRMTDDAIEGFEPITGEVSDASFAHPRWKVDVDTLDDMGIGNLARDVDEKVRVRGININGGDVLLMGPGALGFVSKDGTCRWAHEWDPDMVRISMPVTRIGNCITYSMAGDTKVFGASCPSQVIGEHSMSFADVNGSVWARKGVLLVINRDDGIVIGYKVE